LADITIINNLLKNAYERATCTKRAVAAVLELVDGRLVYGWNGPPDSFKKYCNPCPRLDAKSGTKMDICPAIHAEVATIMNGARMGWNSTKGAVLYISCGLPCKDCMKELIIAGVVRIESPYPLNTYIRGAGFDSGEIYNFNLAYELMEAAGIEYVKNSLLFKGTTAHVFTK